MKRRLSFTVAFVVIILVIYSFEIACANVVVGNQNQDSPSVSQTISTQNNNSSFASKVASSFQKAFDSSKDQIRQLMEEKAKQNISAPTFQNSSGDSRDLIDFTTVDSIIYVQETHGGLVEYASNLRGASDGSATHQHCDGDDSEAFIVGHMSSLSTGPIYITCSKGSHQTCDDNALIIYHSLDGYDWDPYDYIYVCPINWGTLTEINIGEFSESFNYISVCVWSPNPEYAQCVRVDSVKAFAYSSSFYLTISTDGHGTTNPEPGGYSCYGETVEVTAIPYENYEFDHWDIDFGSYQSTDNPIYQQTWDGDHYLTAYFRPIMTLTISATSGGTTNPALGQHQYDYGTGVTVYAIPDQGSSFSYWLLDGEYVYTSDSIYVGMYSNHWLEAHFNEALPTCALTIRAYDYSSLGHVDTNAYVDTTGVGTTDLTVNVALGTRTVSVDEWVYDPGLGWGVCWYSEVDGYLYSYVQALNSHYQHCIKR